MAHSYESDKNCTMNGCFLAEKYIDDYNESFSKMEE